MLDDLATRHFDLLIVGGGILGAFAAWDAATRGLSVALVDRGDFGAATSANSLKVLHGGFRYLQRADVARVRASARERWRLARMAPHLVRPLASVVPTERRLTRSGLAFRGALGAYDWITRSVRPVASDRALPGRVLDRDEYAALAGEFTVPSATGGALWYDGQLESADRFLLGVVLAARGLGAVTANYTEVLRLLGGPAGVAGARVRDEHGTVADVTARMVLNTSNDRAAGLATTAIPNVADARGGYPPFALACNVVLSRSPAQVALAIPTRGRARLLFAVPWRGCTMIGTSQHEIGDRPGDRAQHAARELVRDVNEAIPGLGLGDDEITLVHQGRLPGTVDRLLDSPVLIDHEARDGVPGLVTAVGVKWTTARLTAEQAVDLCVGRLRMTQRTSGTRDGVLPGSTPEGTLPPVASLADPRVRERLHTLYGGKVSEVWALAQSRPELRAPLGGSATIGAQLVYGVRFEMARHLDDLVLRRTELGSARQPSPEALASAGRIVAEEMGWDDARLARELARVTAVYEPA